MFSANTPATSWGGRSRPSTVQRRQELGAGSSSTTNSRAHREADLTSTTTRRCRPMRTSSRLRPRPSSRERTAAHTFRVVETMTRSLRPLHGHGDDTRRHRFGDRQAREAACRAYRSGRHRVLRPRPCRENAGGRDQAYDGDVYGQHNAFVARAASREELRQAPYKVVPPSPYLFAYARLRRARR
jgi:hypothetical protein